MPQAKLIKTDNIQNILIKNGFEIIYTRERIKSDLNSPDHIEIKAINNFNFETNFDRKSINH